MVAHEEPAPVHVPRARRRRAIDRMRFCTRVRERERERERVTESDREREREREIISLEAIDGKSTPGQDRTGDLQRVRLTS